MKTNILMISLVVATVFYACKKERTCSCKSNTTNTMVTTIRSTGASSTTVQTSTSETNMTWSKVKKSEMTGLVDCNSQTQTSVDSYSTIISVATVSTIGTFTFNTYKNEPADVQSTSVDESTCELK